MASIDELGWDEDGEEIIPYHIQTQNVKNEKDKSTDTVLDEKLVKKRDWPPKQVFETFDASNLQMLPNPIGMSQQLSEVVIEKRKRGRPRKHPLKVEQASKTIVDPLFNTSITIAQKSPRASATLENDFSGTNDDDIQPIKTAKSTEEERLIDQINKTPIASVKKDIMSVRTNGFVKPLVTTTIEKNQPSQSIKKFKLKSTSPPIAQKKKVTIDFKKINHVSKSSLKKWVFTIFAGVIIVMMAALWIWPTPLSHKPNAEDHCVNVLMRRLIRQKSAYDCGEVDNANVNHRKMMVIYDLYCDELKVDFDRVLKQLVNHQVKFDSSNNNYYYHGFLSQKSLLCQLRQFGHPSSIDGMLLASIIVFFATVFFIIKCPTYFFSAKSNIDD